MTAGPDLSRNVPVARQIGLLGLLARAFDRHIPHGLSLEAIQARNGRNSNNAPARSEVFSVSPRFLGSRGWNHALKHRRCPTRRAARHQSPEAQARQASRRQCVLHDARRRSTMGQRGFPGGRWARGARGDAPAKKLVPLELLVDSPEQLAELKALVIQIKESPKPAAV
jgi:hypothetical protein